MKLFKMSSLLKSLLFGMLHMGVVDGDGGGDGGEAARVAAEAAAAEAAAAAAASAAAAAAAAKPTDAEAKLLKEVMQKKEALTKSQTDLAAAQERLKEFEGVDVNAVKKLLADQKTAEEAQLVAKGDFDRLKQRMVDEHTKSTQTLNDTIKQLTEQLSASAGVVDELSIGQQFSQSKFIADELTLTPSKARTIYSAHFDLVDGKVVAFDKPRGEANRTAMVDQFGNNEPFEVSLRKIVDADPEKDHLLKSKVKPGAGSESKAKVVIPNRSGQMDSTDKIAAGLKALNLLKSPV